MGILKIGDRILKIGSGNTILVTNEPPSPTQDFLFKFRFANSSFDPTNEYQSQTWNDSSLWRRDTDSEYNDWFFGDSSLTSIDGQFYQRFANSYPGYGEYVLPGATTILEVGDTSNLTDLSTAFWECSTLTNLLQFSVANGANVAGAFYGCSNVASGAYELYQALAASNASYSNSTFSGCGDNDYIPSSWGGDGLTSP